MLSVLHVSLDVVLFSTLYYFLNLSSQELKVNWKKMQENV